jgi:predicted N-acetyltransferase YhbS
MATDENSMADDFSFRLARPEDAPAIVSVIHRAFAQYDGILVPQSGAMHETAATVAARLADESCLVALEGAVPVGCVFYKPIAEALYFGRLAVLPERRGRGLARRLIAEVEAAAQAAGAAAVTLGVRIALPDNVALFGALGYREVGREAHAGFSEPTSLNMEKRLRP